MLGISYILDRLTRSKFDDKKSLRFIFFSTVLSSSALIIAFVLFYLIS